MHVLGVEIVPSVGECCHDGVDVAIHHIGAADGIMARYVLRQHLLHAVHADIWLSLHVLYGFPEDRLYQPDIGIHDEDDWSLCLLDSNIVSLSIATVSFGIFYQPDITGIAGSDFRKHLIYEFAVVINNDNLEFIM